MRCLECGEKLQENASFCHRCGARVDAAQGSSPAEPPPSNAAGGTASPTGSDPRWKQALQPTAVQGDDTELDLWQGRYSAKAMVGYFVAAALGSIAALAVAITFSAETTALMIIVGVIFLVWIGLYLVLLYRQFGVRYYLTSQRFVHESGILWRVTNRVEVIDIDDITFAQGPLERLLGVGTLQLTSSDRTHPELSLPGIDAVQQVASTFDDARRRERRKRGLHIEAV